jgi:hypothetical protein
MIVHQAIRKMGLLQILMAREGGLLDKPSSQRNDRALASVQAALEAQNASLLELFGRMGEAERGEMDEWLGGTGHAPVGELAV